MNLETLTINLPVIGTIEHRTIRGRKREVMLRGEDQKIPNLRDAEIGIELGAEIKTYEMGRMIESGYLALDGILINTETVKESRFFKPYVLGSVVDGGYPRIVYATELRANRMFSELHTVSVDDVNFYQEK